MEIGAEFMLNGKSHSENFSFFISKICSTLFKQNTNRTTYRFSTTMEGENSQISHRKIDWKDQRSFFKGNKTKHCFLLSNIFVRKENSGKIFSFQLTGIDEKLLKKNSWVDL